MPCRFARVLPLPPAAARPFCCTGLATNEGLAVKKKRGNAWGMHGNAWGMRGTASDCVGMHENAWRSYQVESPCLMHIRTPPPQ
jgi:hypothetical protein